MRLSPEGARFSGFGADPLVSFDQELFNQTAKVTMYSRLYHLCAQYTLNYRTERVSSIIHYAWSKLEDF